VKVIFVHCSRICLPEITALLRCYPFRLKEFEHPVSYVNRRQVIREDIAIRVYPGVCQPPMLFLIFIHCPVEISALNGYMVRSIEKYQEIRVGQPLPHGGHIRMFLGDVAEPDVFQFETGDQGGFAGSAGSDYTN